MLNSDYLFVQLDGGELTWWDGFGEKGLAIPSKDSKIAGWGFAAFWMMSVYRFRNPAYHGRVPLFAILLNRQNCTMRVSPQSPLPRLLPQQHRR